MQEDAEVTRQKTEKMENLLYFGFFVLLFMVVGLILDRLTFVFDFRKGDDNKEALLYQEIENQKIRQLQNEQEFKDFKNCLRAGSGYWPCVQN